MKTRKIFFTILMVAMIFSFGVKKSISQVTDIDGNTYKTVTIGKQEWMAENLNVEHYRNGDPIPQVKDAEWKNLTTCAWCYYENNSEKGKTYGKLYNWYAVIDSKGLAPVGWHIPSYDEWKLLITFLGGEQIAGGKLKAVSSLWIENPDGGATNESGFTAIPSGCRVHDGWFYLLHIKGCFWSSSVPVEDEAISFELIFENPSITVYSMDKKNGFSVRCIKD
jgi:uncharacterized protein (TIGR02145 family)